jgi:signal transduction histidine kinase
MADTLREQAATQERARIARELHDVVAHHVSMVAVQAETARLTTPGMPPEGQERLAAIGDTARDALTEMRRLLSVLRADAGGETQRAPQPGLDRIPELLAGAREAGTSVRLTVHGEPAALSPGTDLTA